MLLLLLLLLLGTVTRRLGEWKHGTRTLFFFSFFSSHLSVFPLLQIPVYGIILFFFSSAFIIIGVLFFLFCFVLIAWWILLESISKHHVQLKRGTGATRGHYCRQQQQQRGHKPEDRGANTPLQINPSLFILF
jgi:hypothetical protein